MGDKYFFEHDVWFEPEFDLYPITIRQARYSGLYEGARWFATALEKDGPSQALMDYMYGDDCDAADYWSDHDAVFIGVGNTPNEAVENLIERFKDPTRFMGTTRKEGDSDEI